LAISALAGRWKSTLTPSSSAIDGSSVWLSSAWYIGVDQRIIERQNPPDAPAGFAILTFERSSF
jgi:hypothetical protein